VTEFHDHDIDHRLTTVTRGLSFKPEKTTIEIRGFCATCTEMAA
jgi:Fur family zinc uptake transcriptional regulator